MGGLMGLMGVKAACCRETANKAATALAGAWDFLERRSGGPGSGKEHLTMADGSHYDQRNTGKESQLPRRSVPFREASSWYAGHYFVRRDYGAEGPMKSWARWGGPVP